MDFLSIRKIISFVIYHYVCMIGESFGVTGTDWKALSCGVAPRKYYSFVVLLDTPVVY